MENLDKEVWQGRETKDRLYLKESGAAIAGDRQVQIWLWEPVGSHVRLMELTPVSVQGYNDATHHPSHNAPIKAGWQAEIPTFY